MTWRLGNGTVILQNFVQFEEECTQERRHFWRRYIGAVWKMDGDVECCTHVSGNNSHGI